jgi:serine/threonine protein kinase/Tfp pilus assembly protein PilF
VISELGRGSNAVVYLAEHPDSKRQVAVKVLMQADPEGIARFKQEARLASRLEDPGIVAVRDVGMHGRHHFLAMDYVEGQTLQDRLRRGCLGPQEAAELCRDLAASMEQAHEVGIIHRDLKPANIILDKHLGRSRITDFGLARDAHRMDSLTRTGEILGTPYYMSPEQFLGGGRRVDLRVDVYALGVILYECLTGQRPFEGRTAMELAQGVTKGRFAPPSQIAPEVPAELEAICLRAMAFKADDRYQESADLAEALQDWLDGGGESAADARPSLALIATAIAAVTLMAALLAWRAASTEREQARAEERPRGTSAESRASPAPQPSPSPSQEPSPGPSPSEPAAPPGALVALADDPAPYAALVRQALELALARVGPGPVLSALSDAMDQATTDLQRARIELERLSFLRRRGRYQQALDTVDRGLLGADPETAGRIKVELALCHYRLGVDEEALRLIDEVATGDGAAALTARALTTILRRQQADWLPDLERALELDPDYRHAHLTRVAALTRLEGRNPDAAAAGEALADRYPDEARLHMILAGVFHHEGRSDDARAAITEAINLTDPGSPGSWWSMRGQLELFAKLTREAQASFKRGLEVNPDDPELLMWNGIFAWQAGRAKRSKNLYKRAAYRPYQEFQPALKQLGRYAEHVWFRLNDDSRLQAVRLSKKARQTMVGRARAAPDSARPPLEAALLAAASGEPWSSLIDHAQAAAQAAPDSPEVALELARLATGRDRYALAREWIARALELAPSHALELSRLAADLIWREGNLHDCAPAWEAIHARDPEGPEGLVAKAQALYIRDGDVPGALEHLEKALAIDPQHSRARVIRVIALYQSNEPWLAIQAADQALLAEGALDAQLLSLRAYTATAMFRTLGPQATPYVHAEWEHAFRASDGAYHRLAAVGTVLHPKMSDEWSWAAQLLAFSLEAEPERGHIHQYLGALALLKGQPSEQVLEHWDRAHELEPRDRLRPHLRELFQTTFPDQAEALERYTVR